jgi:hypothetical protein
LRLFCSDEKPLRWKAGIFVARRSALTITVIILFSLVGLGGTAWADGPSAELLYRRCYGELTGLRTPAHDALLLKVQAGNLRAAEACMQLVSRAGLGPSGEIADHTDTVALALLNTMHAFHRSWFGRSDLINDVTQGDSWGITPVLYDAGEPALYLTRALFKSSTQYKDVLTLPTTLEAARERYPDVGVATMVNLQTAVATLVTRPGAPNGVLYGVHETANPLTVNGRSDFRQSLGGGALGTKSYLILNLGRISNEASDGGRTVARRYSKDLLSDLLCRELPVMRRSDALQFVQSTSTLQFRKSSSCTQCHGTMDNMANVTRNLQLTPYPNFIAVAGVFMSVTATPVTTTAENAVADVDPLFSARPSNGHVYLRAYDGKWVDRAVTSVQNLGETLASLDDPYVCAAKRYYGFMTGITVPLDDIHSPDAVPLTADQIKQRDFVIALGKKLKQDQSLPNLIYRIVESDGFKSMTAKVVHK